MNYTRITSRLDPFSASGFPHNPPGGNPARGGRLRRRNTSVGARGDRRGIAFSNVLSGDQSAELASARLNAMNVRFKSRVPWAWSFSYGRALQQPAMETWHGQEANVKAAQEALLHRANCNQAARRGECTAAMKRASA